ncbi:glycosyltransferase [Phocaeicola barnesiae]|uniref:glycosyltransferase n=1 Tax=Phocaeicola barnesiae TaxID=376804 RepID=UPI0025A487E0|nr:glycosyltransferase [Phocaeicola barnesiae]MDM8255601.1 glycosyltransferase [Phocaeicola barnesiae]
MKKTLVICVLFNPSKEVLKKWSSLSSHKNEYIDFCFVDNSKNSHSNNISGNFIFIHNGKNIGIAEAQNKGIEYAIEKGYDYVVFFDQDSIADYSYIENIVNEYNRIKYYIPNIGVLGPTIINVSTGIQYKSQKTKSHYNYKIVNCLISSGSIIEINTLKIVGFMDKRLFIDYVDFEWCWRANSKGYISIITELISLNHKVGQEDKKFLSYPIIISSPFRYYFQYRNWLWLCKRSYVPQGYKFKSGIRKLVEFIVIPMLTNNGTLILKEMLRGIKDGIQKK